MNKKLLHILVFTPLIIHFCFSQNTLNNVFEAKSDFQPVIKESAKYDEVPSVEENEPAVKNFTYGIQSFPYIPSYTISPIFPSVLKSEPRKRLYHAFIKFGYSPFFSMPFGQISISNTQSRNYHLHADYTHFSSSSAFKPYPVTSFSDNILKLRGKKFYKRHTLHADFDYQRNVVYYYGYNTEKNIIPKEHKNFLWQRYQLFHPTLELKSHYRDTTKINHVIKSGYYNYSNAYHETENHVYANILTDTYIHGEHFVTNGDILFFNNRQATDTINHLIISLDPSFLARGKQWNAQIGIRGTLSSDISSSTQKFYFYPNLYFEYNVADHLLVPFLQIGGYLKRNSLYSLTSENPFVDTALFFQNTNYKTFYSLGIKGKLSSHSNYQASVTYSVTENLPYFVTNYNTLNELHNMYSVLYLNSKVLHVNGEVRYHLPEKWNVILYGSYFHFQPDSNIKPYHKPEYILGIKTEYRLGNKISVIVNGNYIGQRWALQKNDFNTKDVRIPAIADINLELEYRYTRFLSFYIHCNNLANQRYYFWDKYPVYGFAGMLGLTFIPF